MTVEDEVKLAFPDGAELPALDDAKLGLTAAPRPPSVLRSVYYDTGDLRLVAAGITLRRRTRAGATSWDLKVPVRPGDTAVRREVSVADRSATPPAGLADVLMAWTGGEALGPVATLRTRRTTWVVAGEDGTPRAEVVDDEVEHLDGRRVLTRFREVEVERHGVPEPYVAKLVRRLEKAGATATTPTKLAHVLDVPAAEPLERVRKAAPVAALLTDALRRAGASLLSADVGARLGEPDAVHQLRVACRRMRSDLRAYGTVLDPEWVAHLADELGWLGGALGAARDGEVVAERVAAAAADLGARGDEVVADVVARRARAADDAAAALRDPRYLALAQLVRTGLDAPPLAGGGGPAARTAVGDVVDAAWRDVERAVRRLGKKGDTDVAWHAVRITAKRARYAAETAAVVAGADAERLAKAAAAVQDVLGTFHDATTTAATVLELAADRPDDGAYGLAAGRVVERELRAAEQAKAGLAPVWRAKAEPALRRWRRR